MTEPLNDGLDFGYDSYISQVPEAIRGQIEPAFKTYAETIKNKFGEYDQQYAPFKEITEQGWTPEHVNVGLNLLQQLNTNPDVVYQALLQEYPHLAQQAGAQQVNQQIGQLQQNPGQLPNTTPPAGGELGDIPPELQTRLDQQEEIIQLLYKGFQQQQEGLVSQQAQQREQAELAQFQTELDKIAPSDKYNRDFILAYVAKGATPQQAVEQYTQWETGYQQRLRSNGTPLVAPAGGGGLPSEPIETSKLSDVQRRQLITNYLEAANSQR